MNHYDDSSIQDFDCYLDNFTNDWTNRNLHELITLVDSENEQAV